MNAVRAHYWTVLVGALANIVGMALPFIFAPQWILDALDLPGGGGSIVWMRQAGLLLFGISILYIAGGRDPLRYTLNAKFAVLVRLTIGLYWLYLVYVEGRSRSFLYYGYPDVIYAIFNAYMLRRALRMSSRA